MADFEQGNRRFRVATPLGPDALLLTGFRGSEGLSRLFRFELDLLAPLDAPADFAKLLGQPAVLSVDLPNGEARHHHGIISRFAQGSRDDTFVHYKAELVPHVWLLTRRERSRIFQRKTAKEILTAVLDGIDVDWQIRDAQATREYCTQYRESDFAFACRIMEEEGVYYYFTHTADGHKLVLSDHPDGHETLPVEPTLEFEQADGGQGQRRQFLVTDWEKVQELRSGKVTLWDHHFELPHRPLDAEGTIQGTVRIGTVDHDLRAGNVDVLERYDYPGGYAEWFDGVDPSGVQSQSANLEKIFEQNRRMVGIRLQEEAARAVTIRGASYCGNLTGGHTFSLTGHYDADGEYVLTTVEHAGLASGDFRSGAIDYQYENRFTCLPAALPFRPARVTPRPTVKGTQTAVVVGPAGEEIFTDPYGRVKVQFHWDREGKHDADSSCWIRVSTIWAGKGWGVIHIPRIGHEVVVDFLEGDPDRPIVLGSVYNADHIPPGSLPKEGMVSGLMSRTTPGGGGSNFNGMRANDTKGKESLAVQAEYDMSTLVKHNDTQTVLVDRKITVDGTHTETVKGDTAVTVSEGKYEHTVATGTATIQVKDAVVEIFENTQSTTVTNGITVTSKTAGIYVSMATKIDLHVGDSRVVMSSDGTITITGKNITVNGSETVTVKSGGSQIVLTPNDIKASSALVEVVGTSKASMGVTSQTVVCDTSKVAVSGAAVNSSAVGIHEITGAVVKIN
jgi:type VI secretion system secreted protein VgrG